MSELELAGDGYLVLVGDCRERLRELAAESVDCVVTSPPYFGLRDYGTGQWEGGDDDCEHVGTVWHTAPAGSAKQASNVGSVGVTSGPCRCGAVRVDEQIGHEPTPDEFVDALVAVFREVRRVLAPHGTAWLNLGDSYDDRRQLCGVPWRVALALQADGWWLRRDVIWHKPNAMPESVKNRPSTGHEYLFMLSKGPRYFYDRAAVLEPVAESTVRRLALETANGAVKVDASRSDAAPDMAKAPTPGGRNLRSVWTIPTESLHIAHFAMYPHELARRCVVLGCPREVCTTCGRPRERIVRETPTTPTSDGSRYSAGAGRDDGGRAGLIGGDLVTLGWTDCGCAYGLEPDALELIATPTGDGDIVDPSLVVGRAGYARPRAELSGVRPITRHEQRSYARQLRESPHRERMAAEAGASAFEHYVRTDTSGARPVPPELLELWLERGWLEHVTLPPRGESTYRRGVVLDPFLGAGTTGRVARQTGRDVVGVELHPANAQTAAERIERFHAKDVRPAAPIEGQLGLLDVVPVLDVDGTLEIHRREAESC